MLKWFKRKPKQEEEPTYCGYILMQSDWYKKQVEDGLIDHSDCLVSVSSEDQAAELRSQGYRNVSVRERITPRAKPTFWGRVQRWFRPKSGG